MNKPDHSLCEGCEHKRSTTRNDNINNNNDEEIKKQEDTITEKGNNTNDTNSGNSSSSSSNEDGKRKKEWRKAMNERRNITLLSFACFANAYDISQWLLSNGADPNKQETSG